MASDTLDLGRVRLVHRGAYNASTVYEFFDCVTYNGSSYLCTAAAGSPAGTLPTVTATWALLAQKGDTGAKGTTGAVGQQGLRGIKGTPEPLERPEPEARPEPRARLLS